MIGGNRRYDFFDFVDRVYFVTHADRLLLQHQYTIECVKIQEIVDECMENKLFQISLDIRRAVWYRVVLRKDVSRCRENY